jgi:hypothetical protein
MEKKNLLLLTGEGLDINNPPPVLSGGGWMRAVKECLKRDYKIITVSDALKFDDYVFVGEASIVSSRFIKRAKKAFIFSLESPLYCEYSKNFSEIYNNDPEVFSYPRDEIRFPSFTSEISKDLVDRSKKRLERLISQDMKPITCCLIASNKFRGRFTNKYDYLNLRSYLGALKNKKWQKSMIGNFGVRLDAVIKISDCIKLDIYGKNWSCFLPVHYKENISCYGIVSDKLETLCRYDLSLCFENYDCLGYMTEKVPQSIICGVLPIVKKGTINKEIPRELYYEWDGNCFDYDEIKQKLEKFRDFFVTTDVHSLMTEFTSDFFARKIIKGLS